VCVLAKESIFFRYMVSKKGVPVDPQKIEAITKWPTIKNANEVQSILWLVSCYWWFIQDLSKITMP